MVSLLGLLGRILWLINIPLTMTQVLPRQMMLVPEVGDAMPMEQMDMLFQLTSKTFWPYFVVDTAAWALLLVIVSTVRKAAEPRA